MSTSNIILSAPTLVVAIGNKCAMVAAQSQTILCRAEPRRTSTLGFLEITQDQKRESGTLPLKKKLEDLIHTLRLHQRLIEAGLGNEPDLPLGVILLADLADSSSIPLYPVLDILKEVLAHIPNNYSYLLLKTAVFESNPEDRVAFARLHLHLQKLQVQADQPNWPFQVYLFDRYKEGIWEVKDDDELNVLMGNFLLALLSGRFAQQIAQRFSLLDARDRKAHFNSAGISALVHDPLHLQDICAIRLARETLETEFLGNPEPNSQAVERVSSETIQHLGTSYEWEEALCRDLPCRPVREEHIRLDLPLADLGFELLPVQEWEEEITGYADYFEREDLPQQRETLNSNFSGLAKNVVDVFEKQLNLLPCRENLYPGMIPAALQTVQEMARFLNDQIQKCLPIQEEDQILVSLTSEYESALENLARLVSAMPAPPRWILYLPAPFSSYARILFNVLFLRKEHQQLLALREQVVQALKRKLAFPLEQDTRRHMMELCRQCLTSLDAVNESLKELRTTLQTARNGFEKENKNITRNNSPFRWYPLNQALIEWAYEQAKPTLEEICFTLLKEGYLEGWRQTTSEKLASCLLDLCRRAYQDVQDISAEESLVHWKDETNESIAATLAQSAVPLLRPNFDLNGDSPSYQTFYLLCSQPHTSSFLSTLGSSAREWQMVETGDPYIVMFCRIRHLISIKSLDILSRCASAAFNQLSKQEQKALKDSFESDETKEQA